MRSLMTSIFLFLGFALSAQQCGGFLPDKKGTKWEITSYNAKDKEIGKANYELVDVTKQGDLTTYTVKVISKIGRNSKTHESMYTATCKNGKFEFSMKQAMTGMAMGPYEDMQWDVDASALEMPDMNADPGTGLKDGSLMMDVKNEGATVYHMEMFITERQVEKHEKKETPVGTFDCVQIKQRITTKTMFTIDMITKEWYSDGIGLVASEVYTVNGKLASYTRLTSFDSN